MSWIVSSILMFACSIVFYLTVKKLQVSGVDKRSITFANYAFPSAIFLGLSLLWKQPVWYPVILLLSLFVARVVFNYVGTIAGYKSMETAPNAGYSLIIQKGYAVYTLFAAAAIYGSEISVRKFILAGVVLVCASLVAIDPAKPGKRREFGWVVQALLAMFCFGSISLSGKFLSTQGFFPAPQLFWTCLMTLAMTAADSVRVKLKPAKPTMETAAYMALLGLAVSGFYYFKLVAEISAPNLGYVGTVNAASNAVYTVLVAILFGDALSIRKFLAVAGMTAALILLLFS